MSHGVVLAGVFGHGRRYLHELAELEAAGGVGLVGVCDVRPLDDDLLALVGGAPMDTDLGRLIKRSGADIGIVATPIHTHLPLGQQVLNAGAHLLLEKPPAPCLTDWRDLLHLATAMRLACQVGFQSLGSHALPRLAALIRTGHFGAITGIGGYGAWSRPDRYYRRAQWAGRRTLHGAPVTDGVLTNPFAHAIATALALDDSTGVEDVVSVEPELFRARPIEADDTSCVRLRTARGTVIVFAGTLCSDVEHDPVLIVHGTTGRAELHYTRDLLIVNGVGERYTRTSPLANLLAHVDDHGIPLQSDIDSSGAFMRVLEAIRTAPEPASVGEGWLRHTGSGDGARVEVSGVRTLVRDCAERLATFRELGAPWAVSARSRG